MAGRIWIDIGDPAAFRQAALRPPYCPDRLVHTLAKVLRDRPDSEPRVHLVRYDGAGARYVAVPWDRVETHESEAPPPPNVLLPPASGGMKLRLRGWVRPWLDRLRPEIRAALVRYVRVQLQAVRVLAQTLRPALHEPTTPAPPPSQAEERGIETAVAAGDVLLWAGLGIPDQAQGAAAASLCAEKQLRLALLVHDLLAVRRPEFVGAAAARRLMAWLDVMLPLSGLVLAAASDVAADLDAYARERGIALALPPVVLPMAGVVAAPPDPPRRPAPSGRFVLNAATIGARGNQALLFRVWRRLVEEMPAGPVPMLVLAGDVGDMAEDLLQQLRNTGFLDGHVLVFEAPDDTELAMLLGRCDFVVHASIDGAVAAASRARAFGKICVRAATSPGSSEPALCFDPENGSEAYRVLRSVIERDPGPPSAGPLAVSLLEAAHHLAGVL